MALDLALTICTFNNARSLARTLDALERQVTSAHRWWALVVDNNSTDETRGTVDCYVRRGRIPGLRVVGEPKQGLMHARRRAVAETDAPLIAFVDDDCVLNRDWVQQAVSAMGRHPRAGALGGQVRLAWESTPAEWLLRHAQSFAEQNHGVAPLQLPASGLTYLVGAGLVVQRNALLASGWIERGRLVDRRGRKLDGGGDTELVLRIRNAGYELWYDPALVLTHHISERRMSLRHLCGLNRGFGRSYPLFETLAYGDESNSTLTAGSILRSARETCRLAAHVIHPRPKNGHSRRDALIELAWAVGRVEGEIGLLLSPPAP